MQSVCPDRMPLGVSDCCVIVELSALRPSQQSADDERLIFVRSCIVVRRRRRGNHVKLSTYKPFRVSAVDAAISTELNENKTNLQMRYAELSRNAMESPPAVTRRWPVLTHLVLSRNPLRGRRCESLRLLQAARRGHDAMRRAVSTLVSFRHHPYWPASCCAQSCEQEVG